MPMMHLTMNSGNSPQMVDYTHFSDKLLNLRINTISSRYPMPTFPSSEELETITMSVDYRVRFHNWNSLTPILYLENRTISTWADDCKRGLFVLRWRMQSWCLNNRFSRTNCWRERKQFWMDFSRILSEFIIELKYPHICWNPILIERMIKRPWTGLFVLCWRSESWCLYN